MVMAVEMFMGEGVMATSVLSDGDADSDGEDDDDGDADSDAHSCRHVFVSLVLCLLLFVLFPVRSPF